MDSATRTDGFNRRRKAKWATCIIGGIIFLFLMFIILAFLYAILRVRSIKIRLRSVNIEDLITNNKSSPSFSMSLKTQVTIKNSNFGHYKFDNSTLVLAYRGTRVGEAAIEKGWVKARSMKRINIVARVSSRTWKRDVSDYRASQKIELEASAQVTGKVHVLKIITRRKIAEMNCTMELDTKTQTIVNMHCKEFPQTFLFHGF